MASAVESIAADRLHLIRPRRGVAADGNKTAYSLPVTRSKTRILVVEDDEELRHYYRHALTFAGFDVAEAADGLSALYRIDADAPDLVVLDLGLPKVSGHTVQQEIKSNAQTRHIPVVVVTGLPADLEELPCVLRKPVRADQLVEAVRRCLASHAVSKNG